MIVAIQIGVRRTRLACMPVAGVAAGASDGGKGAWPVDFATPRSQATWLKRLKEAARKLPLDRPAVAVVSVPGVVDEAVGKVLLSPNLHWIEKADLTHLIADLFSCPACLVQEIRALALGHQVMACPDDDFLLADFGAGVGGAAMVRGRSYQSALAISGELGHTPVMGNDRLCGCGAIGCVETLVSREGLLESFARRNRKRKPTWKQFAAHVGKRGIEPWFEESLDAAAAAVAGAINVLGVRQVIVTGALTELPGEVVGRLTRGIEKSAVWARFGQVIVHAAPRYRVSGLIVAAVDQVLLPQARWEDAAGNDL